MLLLAKRFYLEVWSPKHVHWPASFASSDYRYSPGCMTIFGFWVSTGIPPVGMLEEVKDVTRWVYLKAASLACTIMSSLIGLDISTYNTQLKDKRTGNVNIFPETNKNRVMLAKQSKILCKENVYRPTCAQYKTQQKSMSRPNIHVLV